VKGQAYPQVVQAGELLCLGEDPSHHGHNSCQAEQKQHDAGHPNMILILHLPAMVAKIILSLSTSSFNSLIYINGFCMARSSRPFEL
jgi:hypothetical protein